MKSRFDPLLAILLLISAGLNLFQLRQNRAVHANDEIRKGVALPGISALTLDGQRAVIPAAGDLPLILYVFSPQCGWCDRNHLHIVRLATQLQGRYRFAGISLSERGLDAYMESHPLPFPVYQNPSLEALSAYKMGSTPQTILLSPDGKLERVWDGAYVAELQTEIQEFLHAKGL